MALPGATVSLSIEEWRRKREETLRPTMVWLTLTGLAWLKDGREPRGSDPDGEWCSQWNSGESWDDYFAGRPCISPRPRELSGDQRQAGGFGGFEIRCGKCRSGPGDAWQRSVLW